MVNLLIGMAMGLSVLSAAVFWVHFQNTHDKKILERSHAQQETRALMDTLVHDIRRANFHSVAITPTVLQVNFAGYRKTSMSRHNKFCSASIAMKMG
jgi:Tfp pilus assembly protein PilW